MFAIASRGGLAGTVYREFNALTGYIFCAPVTGTRRDWPFEVPITPGGKVAGMVLADQTRSINFAARPVRHIAGSPRGLVETVLQQVAAILSLQQRPNELRELLTLANGQAGRVKKHRKLFLVGRTRIHIDEVEHLGHFLELEVVLADEEPLEIGVSEAHGLIKRLGILPHQLVEEAYVDLLALTGLSEAAVAAVAAVTSVMPPGATGPLGASAPADPTGAAT